MGSCYPYPPGSDMDPCKLTALVRMIEAQRKVSSCRLWEQEESSLVRPAGKSRPISDGLLLRVMSQPPIRIAALRVISVPGSSICIAAFHSIINLQHVSKVSAVEVQIIGGLAPPSSVSCRQQFPIQLNYITTLIRTNEVSRERRMNTK